MSRQIFFIYENSGGIAFFRSQLLDPSLSGSVVWPSHYQTLFIEVILQQYWAVLSMSEVSHTVLRPPFHINFSFSFSLCSIAVALCTKYYVNSRCYQAPHCVHFGSLSSHVAWGQTLPPPLPSWTSPICVFLSQRGTKFVSDFSKGSRWYRVLCTSVFSCVWPGAVAFEVTVLVIL
jgi:hypothetical protein